MYILCSVSGSIEETANTVDRIGARAILCRPVAFPRALVVVRDPQVIFLYSQHFAKVHITVAGSCRDIKCQASVGGAAPKGEITERNVAREL